MKNCTAHNNFFQNLKFCELWNCRKSASTLFWLRFSKSRKSAWRFWRKGRHGMLLRNVFSSWNDGDNTVKRICCSSLLYSLGHFESKKFLKKLFFLIFFEVLFFDKNLKKSQKMNFMLFFRVWVIWAWKLVSFIVEEGESELTVWWVGHVALRAIQASIGREVSKKDY